MAIVILGWGSLIWQARDLPISGSWQKGGPVLHLEFSRVSQDGRLTLVIDEANGKAVPTRYAHSAQNELDRAISDLQARENTGQKQIGFYEKRSGRQSQWALDKHPIACEEIKSWAEKQDFSGVIWTALTPNFQEKTQQSFSLKAAIHYLEHLDGQKKQLALEYIQNAPEEVMTPLRAMLLRQG
jgi:hypothetical protein